MTYFNFIEIKKKDRDEVEEGTSKTNIWKHSFLFAHDFFCALQVHMTTIEMMMITFKERVARFGNKKK